MTAVLRVAILGAESTGKSTLAAALAVQYHTAWVPEYLREFVAMQARVPFEGEQVRIAQIQLERERQAIAPARRFLFCDTAPFMTALYSEVYWGRVDAELDALARTHDYALTLVVAPDGPWVADGLQRDSAAMRQQVHTALIARLERHAIGFTLLTGSLELRLLQAARVLERLAA